MHDCFARALDGRGGANICTVADRLRRAGERATYEASSHRTEETARLYEMHAPSRRKETSELSGRSRAPSRNHGRLDVSHRDLRRRNQICTPSRPGTTRRRSIGGFHFASTRQPGRQSIKPASRPLNDPSTTAIQPRLHRKPPYPFRLERADANQARTLGLNTRQ